MSKNRLSLETSPYLKQHEENPVDWYPWGEEALARSRSENKPILLSVGYSSCHWCHVMAHESFENPQIAKIMNENFICVKVDREERPDLDMIYQPVAQVFTRAGGWPLTVFLTPDLKPFYGGTYFPPVDKYGRPGFPKVLMALVRDYHEKKDEVQMRSEKITAAIRSSGDVGALGEMNLTEKVSDDQLRVGLQSAAQSLAGYIDQKNGGIGSAPKFPNTSALTFLWRMSLCSWVPDQDRKKFREGVMLSLDGMAKGGIFDQIGGGFHRYSVDAEWVIPHFEKMLYDNGLLLKLYSEVLLQGSKHLSDERVSLYARVLVKTVDWLEGEMKSPEGLFYSALDADSLNPENHLEEGAYYTWTENDHDDPAFKQMLTGLTEDARHALTLQRFETGIASSPQLEILMKKLGAIRAKRARPGLDDKVLTSWTGLAISGLAWASMAFESLEDPESAQKTNKMAKNAWKSLNDHAIKNGELFSTVQKGTAKFKSYLDDEAFFLQATLDLARSDFENAEEYFSFVEKRVGQVIRQFHDPMKLGFFFTQSSDSNELIHRPKNFFDQAIPSGNGVMLSVLATIESESDAGDFTFLMKSEELNVFQNGFGMSEILGAMLLKTVGPVKVEDEQSLAVRAHPFCTWKKTPASGSPVQYCVGQACHRGKFDPLKFF